MTQGNGNTQRYRIEELERRLNLLEAAVGDINLLRLRVDEQDKDVSEIKGDLKSIRRGLWVAAATFASLELGVFTLVAQRGG